MSEMIERVARAIVESLKQDAERFRAYENLTVERTPLYPEEDCLPPPNNGTYDGKIDAVAIARAAIKAMREPKEGMSDAAYERLDWGPPGYEDAPGGASTPERAWQAMIDAALAEAPE